MYRYAKWWSLTKLAKATAFVAALLTGNAVECAAAESEPSATVVEFENPLASPQPLQGYLRQTNSAGPSPAVVLLHGCNGNWMRLDERWGKRIASWGYVTLAVDSFGPRGIKNTCSSGAPVDLAFDAYRALSFLVRQPFVDPARVAALGFSQGGWLALTSVEHGAIEQTSQNKFRAAIAFYPPCLGFKGNMTVPALILIGELDDWTPAGECRNMVDGRDDWGISRRKGEGAPMTLVIYPGAYHAFDAPGLQTPIQFFRHHLEFNQPATDRSINAVREFLDATIGGKEQAK
jgi:dienelactone hydrolase